MGTQGFGKVFAALAFIGCTLATTSASAEADVASYFKNYARASDSTQSFYRTVLSSYENGMAWANATLQEQGSKPLYCPPEKVALTGDQLLDILRRFALDRPPIQKYPFGLALLEALRDAFPCK
jgi:hypothetical protein